MGDAVSLQDVVYVLQAHGVSIEKVGSENNYKIEMKEVIEQRNFTDPVPKRTLFELARKFGCPIHHFWNIDQAPATKAKLLN